MTTVQLDRRLPAAHARLVAQAERLASERFGARAADYDERGVFPEQDFADLQATGLLAACIAPEEGGLGIGPSHGSPLTLWLMTRALARANLSLARCWEGHHNSVVLLTGLADAAQRDRWFGGIVARGQRWVAWSGEPQAPKPGDARPIGTHIERVDGGYRIHGSKVFATSAGSADWSILLCDPSGPGGARHASVERSTRLLLLACNLHDSSITVDEGFWHPLGMRATVSHKVCFDGTFVPDCDVIGEPGQYLAEGWQSLFVPHYAASFLGAAEAAYDCALSYARAREAGDQPHILNRLASMASSIDTSRLWLAHVAELWESDQTQLARYAGAQARHVVEHRALSVVDHAIRVCGARGLMRPSVLERVVRDLTVYVRHDNDDMIKQTLGRAALGLPHDSAFYKP